MKTRFILICITLFVFGPELCAQSRKVMDKPFMIGPQYPLLFMSTTFEPDTAFLLRSGESFFVASYTLLNSYVYSSNLENDSDNTGSADTVFTTSDSSGYSVYFDAELDRRFFKFYYGFSDAIELQFTYRDFRFFPGHLDSTIENFHSALNLHNQGRENTDRDLLEIYIYDNETNENVLIITEASDVFVQESMTLGMKVNIRETENEAISFSLTSNFGDFHIERGINESTADSNLPEHKNFNDYNLTFRYSSLFENWSLHSAFSVSYVQDSLLEKSPNAIYYFFLGANYHMSDNFYLIMQTLEYSSPFPKDGFSTIASDTREITAGFRWFLWENSALDMGLVENQSQGPQNIDIAFFTNLMFYL